MATALPPEAPRDSRWLGLFTGLMLLCCWPVGLIALWTGPWSQRTKVVITVVWLVLFGPAAFYYAGHYYNPGSQPSPSPTP